MIGLLRDSVGTPTVLEAIMALRSRTRGRDPRNIVMGFLTRIDAEIVEFTPVHMEAAAEALLRYGKGR